MFRFTCLASGTKNRRLSYVCQHDWGEGLGNPLSYRTFGFFGTEIRYGRNKNHEITIDNVLNNNIIGKNVEPIVVILQKKFNAST